MYRLINVKPITRVGLAEYSYSTKSVLGGPIYQQLTLNPFPAMHYPYRAICMQGWQPKPFTKEGIS